MKKTLLVMMNEITSTLKRKTFLFFAFGLPILLAIAVAAVILVRRDAPPPVPANTAPAAQTPVGYVDEGGLIRLLPDETPAGWLRAYADESAAQAALDAGQISGYYHIPADYLATGQLTYAQPQYSPFDDDISAGRIESILLFNLFDGDAELIRKIQNPAMNMQVTQLTVTAAETPETWFTELFPTLMVLILYMVILIPAGILVNAITDEKKNRVMELLMTSMTTRQFITGKIVALGILGFVQTALYLGLLWMVARFGGQALAIPPGFDVPLPLLFWGLVYAVLGYLIYGSLMAGLGALAPDFKDVRGTSFILLLPIIAAYMFMIVTFTRPNSPISLFLGFFPLTSPISMIARMTAIDLPWWQPALAALLQLLTGIGVIRLVARLFRAQHLLSGQPFRLSHYFKAMFAA